MSLFLLLLACRAVTTVPAPQPAAAMARQADALSAQARFLSDPRLRGRAPGSPGSALAQEAITSQLAACGVVPAGDDGFRQTIGATGATNLIGRVPGRSPAAKALLVSAHYDHQDPGWRAHPGAADNAASVAVALQLACAFAEDPGERDLIVALWDAEEPPAFRTDQMGSTWWRDHPTIPLDHLAAVLVMDILGTGLWDGFSGSFLLGTETAPALRALARDTPPVDGLSVQVAGLHLVEEMVIGRPMVWSDYDSFREVGLPIAFLTDGQNRRYHTPDDRFEALDLAKLHAQSRWTEAFLRRLDAAPDPAFGPTEDLAGDARALQAILSAASPASASWGDTAQATLTESLTGVDAIVARDASDRADAVALRRATQRLMCWAGPSASVFTCGML